MLKVDVLTLFPEMFTGVLGDSILKRAMDIDALRVRLVNFREYAKDRHKTVDDYPFGGGAGMLLKPAPLFDALTDIGVHPGEASGADRIVLFTPQGKRYTQHLAHEFAESQRIVLICGHYEGFDERIGQRWATDELSMGDFVLTGGEIPAMAVIDSVARFLPGVLGNASSATEDSFSSGLLEHPQYTRPAEYQGMVVPETLLSGNHQRIAEWRHVHALYRTWTRRPDLLELYPLTTADEEWIRRWRSGDFAGLDVPEPGVWQGSPGDNRS